MQLTITRLYSSVIVWALLCSAAQQPIIAATGTPTTTSSSKSTDIKKAEDTRKKRALAIKLLAQFLVQQGSIAFEDFAKKFCECVVCIDEYKPLGETLQEILRSKERDYIVIGAKLKDFLKYLPKEIEEPLRKKNQFTAHFALSAIKKSLEAKPHA